MRHFSIMYKTSEAVLDWYAEQDYHCFRVGMGTTGKNIETGYYGSNPDEAVEKLTAYLKRIEDAENESPFRLETGTWKGGKFTTHHSILFQLFEREKQPGMMGAAPVYYDLIAKINALEQRLAMKEAEETEEEEEEEEPEENNILNGLLNSPQVKNVLVNILANMVTPKQPVAVAGVPETETDKQNLLIEALEILKKNDPELETDLYKLATISENDPAFFKMLVGMLRKQ